MSSVPSSVVVWQGRSAFDGQQIVLIATNLKRKPQNIKTGDMVQTYILRADKSPCNALANGDDFAICGDCPLRKAKVCYVDVSKSVSAVWHAFNRGNTPDVHADYSVFSGKKVRFGAYGDPAAVPYQVWVGIAAHAKATTGYTHQWRACDRRFAGVLMASTESVAASDQANAMGYKAFRAAVSRTKPVAGERVCLNSSKGLQCADCMQCKGNSTRTNILIGVHGKGARNFEKVMS